ncbi:MAG: alpha/beta fold hydrolase [Akkermansiaceae bacterium]|nr:alpha/beta fold hydrolase [Akkermansiaceae bacterium]NNM30849.1 alpha/beta fold hydrolase [Akkermansiaceae bacterium]
MRWMLHGAVGMAADWEVVPEEPGDRRVDLWKYLASEGLSLEAFAERFGEEVAAVDEAPVLVGYSLGGRLALHCLLAHPDLWRAAVIVSAHPGLRGDRLRLERMADDAQWAGKALTSGWGKFLAEWEAQEVFRGPERERQLADRAALEPDRQAVARGFMEWSLGKQADLRERFGGIPCPVLWVTGGRDEKFTGLAKAAVPLLAQGRHEIVPDAGHRVPWDAPDAFRDLVDRFPAA